MSSRTDAPAVAILEFNKIKSTRQLCEAAKHNLRGIAAELVPGGHIDPARTLLNQHLAGPLSALEVARRARDLKAEAGVGKLRKDAVQCVEFLVTLPEGHSIDELKYFQAAMEWLAKDFGGMGNILAADVHRDESHPHMHLLILPLIGGRMVGSESLGGPVRTARRYKEFYEEVARSFGLVPCQERLSPVAKRAVAQAILFELNKRNDPLLRSALYPSLRNDLLRAPARHAAALGIDVEAYRPRRKLRSSTSIFISKGKGSQRRSAAET